MEGVERVMVFLHLGVGLASACDWSIDNLMNSCVVTRRIERV